ncbi:MULTISPECIES: hypothetical protein [unclassified Pseudomonas]|uniref:hypothetical protein n=1 Tax=unclassified Pseudomonas TaxID=196821 RepID=UPI00119CBB78|nr:MULTISPECIES: hypothetical protein [unclassified Pseudomonas]TWC27676.1 hypothetical protein FBY05_101541 [Pseudomonas sp. SJZ083]TWC53984.1 hypothetical protein FBY01_101175 [Pseudomonas sp. SJZ077]
MADLIQGLDGPRTAQQELFYDLEDLASVIRWSVIELTDLASRAKTPPDALALAKVSAMLTLEQVKLGRHADEVKAGRIVRGKAE